MPKPLGRKEASRLSNPSRSRWNRRTAPWLVLAGGLVTFVVVNVTSPDLPCTEASPCEPDQAGNLLIGALAVVPFLAWLHLWFAATAALAMSGGLISYDLVHRDQAFPLWVHLLVAAYAAGCVLLARTVAVAQQRSASRRWHDRAELLMPPSPVRSVRPPLVAAFAGSVLLSAR